MNVILFGQLVEAARTRTLVIEAPGDTEELIRQIEQVCPALRGQVYHVAVNHDIVHVKTILAPDAEVALLPPYSGG